MKRLPNADWLEARPLQHLLEILCERGEEARVNGGAVRNSLLGESVADVDISTTLLPQQVIERFDAAGFKTIPTGIDHGTVTVVIDGAPFEVTTLRSDIETDGRRAVVRFGRDWAEDALRRDFTINALYVDREGVVHDPLGGMEDIEARRVRFIGEAEDRIKEDHLRILRFFRFFAWYGHGAPDRDGLRACVRMRQTLTSLSAERVWKELKRTLSAPDPSRAILWMRQAGILSLVLVESEKWGIDALSRLVRTQQELNWGDDPMLRLMAIIPPNLAAVETLAGRLKLSNADGKRLADWASSTLPSSEISELALAKKLYGGSQQGIIDTMRLELARLREAGASDDEALMAAAAMGRLLDFALSWTRPKFPVKGRNLIARGIKPGREMGEQLKALEECWIESGFMLGKKKLLDGL